MMLFTQFVCALAACVAFAIMFNAPRKELFFCGMTGALGWVIYKAIDVNTIGSVWSTFFAAIVVTASARYLSHFRRAPSTLYLIPGIIPLVPGAGMYHTMYGVLNSDMVYSYSQGVTTMKLAGVIAVGSIIVLSLPYSVFTFVKLKDKETAKK